MAERAEIVLSASDKTAQAFASAKRNLTQLQASTAGLVARFGAVAAGIGALGVAFSRLDPRSVIDAADELQKLSQRSGIAVENLSALQYAGKLADVSTEELADSVKKLNVNIAAAARGEKEQAAAFATIGVAVKDAAGQVRDADQVLGDIADKFSTYADGANKVALANALGGRSFEKLIPLLNGGRQGLAEARAEAERFGAVISGDLAAKSEKFNDNITRLGIAADALKVAIAGSLIDGLVEYSNEAVEAAKNTDLLGFALRKLFSFTPVGLSLKVLKALYGGGDGDTLQLAQQRVDGLNARIEALQANLARDPGNGGLLRQLQFLQDAAKAANADLAKLQAVKVGEGLGTGNLSSAARAALFDKDRTPVAQPRQAPALPGAGGGGANNAAAEADALLRKQLEGRLKAIADNLETQRDLFQFNEQRLAELYASGRVSIDGYFDAKARAQAEFLALQKQGFDAEIAALTEVQAKLPKAADRQDIENKIGEVLARQARAYREAGQAAEVAGVQRERAAQEFQTSLAQLDAQLAELSGDRFGAELLRNAEQLAQARALLAKGGGDSDRESRLAAALDLQTRFAQVQADTFRLTERAQVAEEAFLVNAQRLNLSRAETEEGVREIRERSIVQLDALIERTAKLAEVSTDPALIAFYEQLRLVRERAFDAKDPGLVRFNDLAREAGEAIATSFEDAIVQGKSLSEVIGQIDKQLVALITRDLVTQPLADLFTGFIKGLGAGGTGGGAQTLLSGLFSSVGSLFLHGGGVVGEAGTWRAAPAVALAGLPRYHSGGVAGLQPDEMHAVLRKGEEVLTQSDPRHRNNGGGAGGDVMNYSPTFVLSGPIDRSTQSQIAARALDGVQRGQRNR